MSKIIDPDVRTFVEKLEQKIAKLQRLKLQILEEFSDEDSDDSTRLPQIRKPPENKKTRKQEVIDFLLKNGPTARKDIVAHTGIPVGTISFALNDEAFQNIDGKWDVADSLKTSK